MKKGLKVLGVIVLVLVLLNVIPTDVIVEKTTVIDASKRKVVKNVAKFENFVKWSPWADLDPKMKYEISGDDGKVGAKYSWSSKDSEVGEGSMTIALVEEDRIEQDLDLITWDAQAKAYYTFKEVEKGVEVTWGMNQEASVMASFFIESMVGKSYEKGLASLKKLCEE